MGLLDRLLGRRPADQPAPQQDWRAPTGSPGPGAPVPTDDERAVERYRYLLRTAPPDQIERAHEEAFAQFTPEQRRQVLQSLTAEGEQGTADDPRSLARSATRLEMRKPGTLERSFGGGAGMGGGIGMGRGMGMGMGGLIGGSLLGSVAGAFIGSAIAQEMFDDDQGGGEASADDGTGDAGSTDGGDGGGDPGGGDSGGGDSGGGDFGGGDFGGGDFGGGDF